MREERRRAIVLVSSTLPDDPLAAELAALVEGCPPRSRWHVTLDGADDTSALVDLVEKVSGAAYVVIQEPAGTPRAEHIAAAAAARACAIPLLLMSPASSEVTTLMRISNAQVSQVVHYPTRRDDARGWRALRETITEKNKEVLDACGRAERARYLNPITARLTSAAATLEEVAPSEETARTVARIFDAQTGSIKLENSVDCLQLDLPANLYTELLAQLTSTFRSVRTIADPVAEELPWDDPVDSQSLAAVTERIFAIDEDHARQYGLEAPLAQLHLGLKAGGRISVVGLSQQSRSELLHKLPSNQRLKGLNRFYAGENIIGGYADEPGTRVRLLAYHDTDGADSAYARELEVLSEVDQRKQIAPKDRKDDPTALASWLYSHVLTEPQLDAIFDQSTSEYADEYDGNIVRVTPGYFGQLDALTAETKRALVALYAPFSGRDRRNIRVLELGVGTGAFTGRLMRVCAEFLSQMRNDSERAERSFIELDGWDANARMIEIATQRLTDAARLPADILLQPNLKVLEYDPADVRHSGDPYDLVLGSFVSHYWVDARPNRAVTRVAELQQFTGFLESIRTRLLNPGGMALFLDAFYTPQRRDFEQRAWRHYVANELDSSEAAHYLERNSWQFHAPTSALVQEAAESLGFKVWWRDALPGQPFKILIVTAPQRSGSPETVDETR